MAVPNEWFFPRGSLTRGTWESVVDATVPGWRHTGLRVAVLGGGAALEGGAALSGGALELPPGETERIVVPLSGEFRVDHDGTTTELAGRRCVFDGPAD